MASERIELCFWELKDELTGKRRRTLPDDRGGARIRHGDNARKIEGTFEIRGGDPRELSMGARIMENLPPPRGG